DDPEYDPYPEQIYIHDNTFIGGGTVPAHALLAKWHAETGENSPDIVWGGLVKPGGSTENLLCLGDNPTQTFLNLNGTGAAADVSSDTAPHACTLPRLEPIQLSTDLPGDD
ncbi:MAG: hypothetical protein L7S70_02675, partial [Pseudomonadales bacterium]|nr:hypothetical protein [Pseudomonadales bacterium]